jgi:hypothetical protein
VYTQAEYAITPTTTTDPISSHLMRVIGPAATEPTSPSPTSPMSVQMGTASKPGCHPKISSCAIRRGQDPGNDVTVAEVEGLRTISVPEGCNVARYGRRTVRG